MVIDDADAAPFGPEVALFEIVIDRIVFEFAAEAAHPTSLGASRVEAVAIGDEQCAARLQHPRHLSDWRADLRHVEQAKIADHKVKARVAYRQRIAARFDINTARIALACMLKQRACRIDAGAGNASGAEHAAEAALAAADIQHRLRLCRQRARRHYWIEHIPAPEIAVLSHVRDPSVCGLVPTIF